ncbi:28S ribosomal protein S11, mitochondrial [Aphelenchoides bicaudatus]|nr:28S ribosomal protein S11, mitochondrial [Aphelenchoides bicaudatus]
MNLLNLTRNVLLPNLKSAAFFDTVTPAAFSGSIRDEHRTGVRIKEINTTMEGTVGTESYLSVNTDNIDKYMPTAETLNKEFFGIVFNELPIIHIKASKNNTIIQVFDHNCIPITYTSCRMEGFKNARKKTTIAGQATGVAAGHRLLRRGINAVRILVKGLGPGRMTSVKGIASTGVNVVSITDRTPLPELGPRPKKMRRV